MMARMLVNKMKTMHDPKPDCGIFTEVFCAAFILRYSQKSLKLKFLSSSWFYRTLPSSRPQAYKIICFIHEILANTLILILEF